MRLKLIIANDQVPEGWEEIHSFEDVEKMDQAEPFVLAMVDKFNAILRPGELPRRFVRMELAPPQERDEYQEMLEATRFSDVPEGCCPSCWDRDLRVEMEYRERWDQDVCPECGYT